MELPKRITRLVSTAHDFKYSMPILCYYTQLYTVQQILALKERTEEQTVCATQLLDQVETFKQGIPEDDKATRTLVHDQDKAKMYVLSFAMSLYNSMLQQVKDGGASRPLARGLWCCIDLFEMAVDTWKGAEMTLMEQEQCLKKIKFCKYYLAKLAKGEATGVQQGQEEQSQVQEEQPQVQEEQPQVQEEQPQMQEEQSQQEHGPGHNQQPTTPELDYADFLEGSPPRNLEDEDVDSLLEKMRALDSSNHPKDSPQEESQPRASEAHDAYINEPPLLPDAPSFSPAHNSPGGGSPAFKNESVDDGPDFPPAPTFVDLDSGDESSGGNVNDHHHHHHASQPLEYQDEATSTGENKYTKQDIYELMSRAEAIDKAQRSAKYAISALNYEDIATAREELTQALQALASLEQRGK